MIDGALLAILRGLVGDAHVLTDAGLRASHETDWTRRWRGEAVAVVRPGSTDEVAAVLRACREAGVAVIPQGGNTGLVGGSVPRTELDRPQLVLALARLRELEPVDALAAEVTAGAGVILATLQAHARASGYAFGVDLGARDSATLGGMAATNAGGIQVLRHGPMRRQIVGFEAVLADGTVLRRLPGLVKDNTGYHLPSLLAGSEGTLAVITRLRLRLVPLPARRAAALLALDGPDEVAALAAELRRQLPNLLAAELMFEEGLQLVTRHAGLAHPFGAAHPAYLLVEADGAADPTDELAAAIERAGERVRDAVIASDEAQRRRLWELRERHTESVNATGVPHKLDVAVPIGRMGEYAREVQRAIRVVAPEASVYLYGHVGDGNLHVNVVGPPPEDETVDAAVLELAIAFGGTISAEHGIGVAKTAWLEADRGAADVAAMRAIKRALDPDGVLNPGVLFAG
ncbi:MAG TPA: FAD-binding oxidoreductase [candidate division Zixibacteria bacterium]|nr:FAD-binding oxidoreductase [candidate division Zixibacteria bacterium]